jgi:hypothetical protein
MKKSGANVRKTSSKEPRVSRSKKLSPPPSEIPSSQLSSQEDKKEQYQSKEIVFDLTPKQSQAYKLLTDDKDCALLFGAAKGPGKTTLFCIWVFVWAHHLIKLFGLKPTQYPPPLGFIGRKRAVDFTDTTLETFKRVIPHDQFRINTQDKEIIIKDTAKVLYGGLDDQININKFNSFESAFIGIDQAEETERTDVSVLQASLRLKLNGIQPPYKELYTANPAECWLKQDFIIEGKGHFIGATWKDNPHLPPTYGDMLEKAFGYDEALLSAYRDGNWDAVQNAYTLIPSGKLEALKTRTFLETVTREGVVCDPSQGGDECVIYRMSNTKILQTKIMHEKDTMKITGQCDFMMREIACRNFVVDGIGIGAGVGDRMKELEWNVYKLVSSEKSKDSKFFNIRAEMWFYVAELIRQGKCEYPEDEELRRQLCSVRYQIMDSTGCIKLEPKDMTKKRLGRSPDRADSFVMWVWAKDHAHFGDAVGDYKRRRHGQLQRTYSSSTPI